MIQSELMKEEIKFKIEATARNSLGSVLPEQKPVPNIPCDVCCYLKDWCLC